MNRSGSDELVHLRAPDMKGYQRLFSISLYEANVVTFH